MTRSNHTPPGLRPRGRLALAVAAVAALVVLSAPAPLAAQALRLTPCTLPGVTEAAHCGTWQVAENRDLPGGRRLSLRVALLPARHPGAGDPIVILQGGPGVSNLAGGLRLAEAPLRDAHPFLLVELRGTGGEGALACDMVRAGDRGVRTDFFPVDRVRECRDSLATFADLARYTTPDLIEDLVEVLDALGIRRVNLWGFSGGTRQALAMIRRDPARVRTALLEGPVPFDARVPATFAADLQAALDGIIADCRAEAACRARYPRLGDELAELQARLDRDPPVLALADAAGGPPVPVRVTRPALAQVLRYMLYTPAGAREVPAAIHQASRGQFLPIAERLRTLMVPGAVVIGVYLSSTCAEDLPWVGDADARASAGTLLGDYRIRQQAAACAIWPRRTLPAGFHTPLRSDVPVLILAGERDPATPPRWGDEIARTLPQARVLVVPGGGHALAGLTGGECLDQVRQRFLQSAGARALDTTCLARVRRAPFVVDASAAP